MEDRNASSPSEQLYFLGKIHALLPRTRAIQNARNIVARFNAATPSTDSQVLIWSDASRGGNKDRNSGGIGIVCDICLPSKPKYTIEEAEYFETPGNNVVIAEAMGILKGLRRVEKAIKSARLERGTRVAITIITDCQSNVRDLSMTTPLRPATASKYMAVIESIKILSQLLLQGRLNVTLELHWCPRNTTPQMRTADFLAGHARVMRKCYREIKRGAYRVSGRVFNCQEANTDSRAVKGPGVALEKTEERSPAKGKHTRGSRRRKIPMGTVVEEEVGDSLESALRQNKRRRLHNEEPQVASSYNKPQDTVPVPANTEDQPTDDAQNHLGGRRWYHCMVM